MKVVVLFDGISALGKTPDLLILETVEAVEAALVADGHEPTRVPVNPDGRWIERVRRAKPDLAFNLCEGIDGIAVLESSVISSLELLGVPYTGSGSWTTSMSGCGRTKPIVATRARESSMSASTDPRRWGRTNGHRRRHPSFAST